MFCPDCGREYPLTRDECADCRVPLEPGQPEETDEPPPATVRGWELNRQDSLAIAFVKGALIGMACAHVLAIIANFGLRQVLIPGAGGRGPGAVNALNLWGAAVSMFQPLGIIIGGYIGQYWRR